MHRPCHRRRTAPGRDVMTARSRLAPVQRRVEELLRAARQVSPAPPPPPPPAALARRHPDLTPAVLSEHPTGDQLFAYWEGQLDEPGRAAVEAHANCCPAC